MQHEMEAKGIPGIAVTLVDDEGLTWSRGYSADNGEISESTVYRVASVSKLFTAMSVMQLVEQGVLDWDRPITDYAPGFKPDNPFGTPITLRQLVTHRSGLVREPPVGNYFDDSEPGLEATVNSLNATTLVLPPETATKYSNAAVSVAGFVIEQVTGMRFEEYVQTALIDKLGMESTSFSAREDLRERLGAGYMWRHDTSVLTDAPVFELGIGPAANLYTTTDDLGQLIRMLLAISGGEHPDILSSAALKEMWTPQWASSEQTQGFGLGFYVSRHAGELVVGHAGVMYGYATRVWLLPERRVGAAVVSNVDATNPVVDRVARYAIDLILANREGAKLPDAVHAAKVDSARARALDGVYQADDHATIALIERNGALLADYGAERFDVRVLDDHMIIDGRLGYDRLRFSVRGDTLDTGKGLLVRQKRTRPPASPEAFQELIGEYGWDHNVLYVYEDQGQLHVLIEWFFRYPLEALGRDVYRLPTSGLYMHETLTFVRNARGQVIEANLAGIPFARRDASPGQGTTFRIMPQKPIDELRATAAAAHPPSESGPVRAPDLVDITTLDPTIRLDIRYATSDNFMGAPFYQTAKAFLQRPAAEALVQASQALATHGFGLIVYDGYRPWRVTKMFWDATPDSLRLFVADPSRGSRHNRGCAVDLGLYELETGAIAEMPSGYDEFTGRAFPDYPGGTSRSRYHRELLRDAMEEAGFTVYEAEWWHFDYKDWRHYPIINESFKDL